MGVLDCDASSRLLACRDIECNNALHDDDGRLVRLERSMHRPVVDFRIVCKQRDGQAHLHEMVYRRWERFVSNGNWRCLAAGHHRASLCSTAVPGTDAQMRRACILHLARGQVNPFERVCRIVIRIYFSRRLAVRDHLLLSFRAEHGKFGMMLAAMHVS